MSLRPRPDLGTGAAIFGTSVMALIFALILWAGVLQFDGWFKLLPAAMLTVLGPPVILVTFWARGVDEEVGKRA
jgi:hypothetical protein